MACRTCIRFTRGRSLQYSGRVTVPVLWDKRREAIVSNESAEIIRMLNAEFAEYVPVGHDYYPSHLRSQIDDINAALYENVNNGVYRCGFARTQKRTRRR